MYARERNKKKLFYIIILHIIMNPYECDHSREHYWHRFLSQRHSQNNNKYVYIYINATRTNQLIKSQAIRNNSVSCVHQNTTTLVSNKHFDKYVIFKQHSFSLERNAARRRRTVGRKKKKQDRTRDFHTCRHVSIKSPFVFSTFSTRHKITTRKSVQNIDTRLMWRITAYFSSKVT